MENTSIQILNPAYDTVFKLIMQDLRVAKFLIGTIIGAEVLEVYPFPNENATVRMGEGAPKMLRFDYSAKIRTSDGEEKIVSIEVQKAYDVVDIKRFREYLSEQLRRELEPAGKRKPEALPVIAIYFLGAPFPEVNNSCLRVDHEVTDMESGERVTERISFIERILPKGFFIVFDHLAPNLRTRLGRLLSVFVQDGFVSVDGKKSKWIKEYREKVEDPEVGHLIRLLQAATGDNNIRKAVEEEAASERFVHLLLDEERERSAQAELRTAEAEQRAEEFKLVAEESQRVAEESRRKAAELAASLSLAIRALFSAGHNHHQIATALNIDVELVRQVLAE